ncbi:hypothetical protein K503DRAFT_771259 [Rhizopogon vinicolor AM-OR11-026]|uniref:Uncharacterized protein n=1 Tax=Rhizopogon vinicolor AM-OR11-026 TaxID=1314800 RepID=A0A1B7MYK2_9AGAM|nr:hypothetical protein K503DRAFT_771259 [Rhizopogon vinicolor AM-OR11-026]
MISIPFTQSGRLLPWQPLRPNEWVQVNPDSRTRHFILVPISCDWNAKLACASRTLPDNVREYHRRLVTSDKFTDRLAT